MPARSDRGEIAVKVGHDRTRQDGDVLHVFTSLQIRKQNSESFTHQKEIVGQSPSGGPMRRLKAFQGNQYIQPTDSINDYEAEAAVYRFRRLSVHEMEITRLSDGAIFVAPNDEWYTNPFNGKNERGEWNQTIRFFERSGTKPLFIDSEGKVYYYGGTRHPDHDAMDRVWTAVENQFQVDESDHIYAQQGRQLTDNLVLPIWDVDEATKHNLTVLLTDGISLHRHSWYDNANIPGNAKSDLMTPGIEVDIRDQIVYVANDLVERRGHEAPVIETQTFARRQ